MYVLRVGPQVSVVLRVSLEFKMSWSFVFI